MLEKVSLGQSPALSAHGRERPGQDWPTRPLTLVVPYAAGGSVDGNGRTMAQRMGEVLGQQIVIENVGGGWRHDRLASRFAGAGRTAINW